MQDRQIAQSLTPFAEALRESVLAHPAVDVAVADFAGAAGAVSAAVLAGGLAADAKCYPPCVTLAVVPGIPEAEMWGADLETIAESAGVRVLVFPPELADDAHAQAARLKVSAVLGAYAIRPYPLVIISSVPALAEPVPVGPGVAQAEITLSRSENTLGFTAFTQRLAAVGYVRESTVTAPGQYAVRGGVVDAWSPDASEPARAEFFGEELEDLRLFDSALQTAVQKIATATFLPIAVTSPEKRDLAELLPAGSVLLLSGHNAYPHLCDAHAAFMGDAVRRRIYAGDPAPAGVPTVDFVTSPLPGFAMRNLRGMGSGLGSGADETCRKLLTNHLAALRKRGGTVVTIDALSAGFEIPGFAVVTRADRLPGVARHAAERKGTARRTAGERLSEAFDLEPGELVVHLDYGIGRFLGSSEVVTGGVRNEVFTIEYAEGARLHVPVTHAHLLSRYMGVKGQDVSLHRIDGTRWKREKDDAKKAVQDLAAALLETQAKRAVVPGFAYQTESDEVAAFEAAFPYEPTPDQADAIEDVKRDMSITKPMDRLVCGDAGFGKTEVAMRAAFIAAQNGRQVAVLAPTTILAEQHYETFLSRFDGTAVTIEILSRFCSSGAKKETYARLTTGATDIIIGTHALLSEKVHFHDLGLIVIDEEQRFGVRDKEHLKHLRETADVLTLSATPIPRTLYLSMTGARDLSVLKTPPRERTAVETHIVRDADETVRNALERELARGGQAYFLYNRVLSIEKAYRRLRALVPDARIDVAHGQMPGEQLAAKMRAFASGRTDILLCTSIVESGLDIARANTILVDHAERFGIAELYQLRGRVGRSARQGYAYFLLPQEGLLDAEARERLDALRKHTGQGSGYALSLRDLEIRGAGNLLGSAQSGHIAAVGFALYCQLLQRTIARLKGERVPETLEVSLNLDFLDFSPGSGSPADAAALPYDYVEDEAQRLDFHKRIAEATDLKRIARLKRELADRYGRLPAPAARLVKLAEFRVRCASKHVGMVSVKGNWAFFSEPGAAMPRFKATLGAQSSADSKIAALFKMLEKL